MRSIAIFGGTFDPVHNGHILTSLAIQAYFNFDSFYFIPCKTPTLKPATLANNQQRIEMLRLAIKNHEEFNIDLREVNRDSPSYMVETLESLRKEHTNDSITLIMGYDAFLTLPQWYQWEKIIGLANLLIINREQFSTNPIPKSIEKLLNRHKSETKTDLLTKKYGNIHFFDAGNYDISSTSIREALKNKELKTNNVPKEVCEYIKQWGLYQ